MTTARFAHANVEQPDSNADVAATIAAVLAKCDVVTFNECVEASTHATLAKQPGWTFNPKSGELVIGWRTGWTLIDSHTVRVMQGGLVGADGTTKGPDNRRVGPSRYLTWALLRNDSSGRHLLVCTHHAVAKADTTEKWRRGIRGKGFAACDAEIARVLRYYEPRVGDLPVIFSGDWNTIGAVSFPTAGLVEVRTPATYGKNLRYDRIHQGGPVQVTSVGTLRTKADHLALTATVTLSGATAPTPAPAPATRPTPAPPAPAPAPPAPAPAPAPAPTGPGLDAEAAFWYPGDPDPGDKMRVKQQIGQLRGYAQGAADSRRRVEAAVKAIAESIDPATREAVEKALRDVVDVAVSTQGQ